MTAKILRIPNPHHEAICIMAIRARKRREGEAVIVERATQVVPGNVAMRRTGGGL